MSKRTKLLTAKQVKSIRLKLAAQLSRKDEKRIDQRKRKYGSGEHMTTVLRKDWGKLGGIYWRLTDHEFEKKAGMYDGVTVEEMNAPTQPAMPGHELPKVKHNHGVLLSREQFDRAAREYYLQDDNEEGKKEKE